LFLILSYKPIYTTDFISTIASAVLQSHGVKPKLGSILVTLDVGMRRLLPVAGVKEESIGADA